MVIKKNFQTWSTKGQIQFVYLLTWFPRLVNMEMGNMGYLFPSCITINAGLVRKQNSTLKPTPSIFFFPSYRRAIHSRRSSDMSNWLAPSSLSIHLSPCTSFSSSLTIVFYGLYLFLLYCLVCTVNRFCGKKKMIACFDS